MKTLAALGAVLRDIVVLVVVAPVREGRLRTAKWPVGLAPIVVVALIAYALAIAGTVAGGALRAGSDLVVAPGTAISLPAGTAGAVLASVVLCIVMLQVAVLHVPWWLAAVVTTFTTLVIATVAARDTADGFVSVPRIVALAAIAGLWTLLALRRRRRFAWWEFVVVLVAVTAGVGVPVAASTRAFASVGIPYAPVLLADMLQTVGLLAFPAALAAGAAVVQLSCAMATASVASVRRHLPLGVGIALLVILLVWRGVATVAAFTAAEDPVEPVALAASVVLLAALIGSWLLIRRLRGRSATPQSDELETRFAAIAPRVAALTVIALLPAVLLFLAGGLVFALTFADGPSGVLVAVGTLLSEDTVVWVTRVLVGLALLGVGLVQARRGRTVLPELLVAIGIVCATSAAARLAGATSALWTGPAFLVVVTVVAVILLAVLAVRRRLTTERTAALATVLLVAALFDQRTFVEDPLRLLLGFTGAGFVVFGFVWSLLTGGRDANLTSRAYPRPSRVLLYLGSALFGVTVLAFAALVRDPGATIDLSAPAGLGEDLLGTGLLAAVVVTAFARAVAPPTAAGTDAVSAPTAPAAPTVSSDSTTAAPPARLGA